MANEDNEMLIDHPTAEQVTAHLDAIGRDATVWLGAYGASPTPGVATIKVEPARKAYRPTYGYIRFASQLLCWRIFSQRTAEPAFRPECKFQGGDLIGELTAACKDADQLMQILRRNGEWVDVHSYDGQYLTIQE